MKSFLRACFVGVVSVALISACANPGGEGEQAKLEGSKAIVESVQKDESVAKMLPTEMRDRGQFVVSINANIEPVKFIDENGEISGVSPDLLRAAGRVLGVEAVMQEGTFDAMIPGLQAKRFDVIASIADFVERQTYVDFIDYMRNGTAIIANTKVAKDTVTVDDLCGLSIGYARGSSQQGSLENAAKKCVEAGKPALQINGYADSGAGLLAVKSGQADGYWGDLPQVVYNVNKHPDLYKKIYESNTSVLGIGINKENTQFRDSLRAALLKLVEDGTYMKIMEHWGQEKAALPEMDVNSDLSLAKAN